MCSLPPYMERHPLSHPKPDWYISYNWGTYVTSQCQLKFLVDIRAHSWCCTFSVFGQMCKPVFTARCKMESLGLYPFTPSKFSCHTKIIVGLEEMALQEGGPEFKSPTPKQKSSHNSMPVILPLDGGDRWVELSGQPARPKQQAFNSVRDPDSKPPVKCCRGRDLRSCSGRLRDASYNATIVETMWCRSGDKHTNWANRTQK